MPFVIHPQIQDSIIKLATSDPGNEICGYWSQSADIVYPVPNISPNPVESFEVDLDTHLRLIKVYPDAVIFHSHVGDSQGSKLSQSDILNSKKLKIPYLVYHAQFCEWDYFDPNSINSYPLLDNPHPENSVEFYLGQQWQWERFDCYTLFRNYYRGVLGINLRDFSRLGDEDCIADTKWNQYTDNYASQGFRALNDDDELQDHDVMLMTLVGNQIHHCAIVIDAKNKIAIHVLGEQRFSKRFKFGRGWMERTRLVIRHKSFKSQK